MIEFYFHQKQTDMRHPISALTGCAIATAAFAAPAMTVQNAAKTGVPDNIFLITIANAKAQAPASAPRNYTRARATGLALE